jgi:beta-barrel assembly-enhancing protease
MWIRLAIGAVIALFSVFQYFTTSTVNPVTGEKQRIRITPQQEVAMGRQQAPQMAQEFGGPHQDPQAQGLVKAVGARLVNNSVAKKSGYPFSFTLLADPRTINAFALPGGPIFITAALLSRLKTEGQLAGVLGHEIGHVIGRHSAEHMAKSAMVSGMANAAILTGIDPTGGAIASGVAQMKNLSYGRADETESDEFGIEFMVQAGYDPRALIEVMKVLAAAGGGGRQPEIMSSHPNPLGRAEHIAEVIKKKYPNGVPAGLKP